MTKKITKRRLLSPILLAIILMVSGSVSMITFGMLAALLSGGSFPDDPQQYLILHPWPGLVVGMFAQAAVGFFGYRFLAQRYEGRDPIELAIQGAVKEFLTGSLVGAAFISTVMLTISLMGAYRIESFSLNMGIVVGFSLGIGGAFLEEAVFRGFLMRGLYRKYGASIAIIAVSVIFGGIHMINGIATGDFNAWGAFAIAIEAGLFLSAAYFITRRLWFVIGIHFMWNFMLGGIFGQYVSGLNPGGGLFVGQLSGPDWLTGGKFGIEASLVTVIIGAVFGVYLLKIAKRKNDLSLK